MGRFAPGHGPFGQGVFDTALFDEIGLTKAIVLADPDFFDIPWMGYIAIASSAENNGGFLVDELHRKQAEVWVIRNTYFAKATFGLDEPTADDLVIKSVGLFHQAIGSKMGEIWILDSPVDKDNIDEIVIEVAVTIIHEL